MKNTYLQGVNDAFEIIRGMSEALQLQWIDKVIESGEYKKYGYKTAEEFCNFGLRLSDETIRTRRKILDKMGPNFIERSSRMGLKKHDVKMIAGYLDNEKAKEFKKTNILPINGKEIPFDEDHRDDILTAIETLKEQKELTEKDVKAKDRLIEQHHKHSERLEAEVKNLEKKVSALEPPATEEGRKQKFLEQTELVFRYLADAGKLMNHTMDFSLILKDRDCAVKYRGAVKVLSTLAQNLENKIGEVD